MASGKGVKKVCGLIENLHCVSRIDIKLVKFQEGTQAINSAILAENGS